jgi:hypothetical protein
MDRLPDVLFYADAADLYVRMLTPALGARCDPLQACCDAKPGKGARKISATVASVRQSPSGLRAVAHVREDGATLRTNLAPSMQLTYRPP